MQDLTPGSWLSVLEDRLDAQADEIAVYDGYYEGRHRMAFATSRYREQFGSLFDHLSDNWCEIVVDAPVERLKVEGIRFGDEQDADADAWKIWQANSLDADSVMAHTEAVKDGRSYLLVAPPDADSEYAQITVEHGSQVIVAHAAGNRRVRLAALKRWLDDSGYLMATLYLSDSIHKWRSEKPMRSDSFGQTSWVRRAEDPGGANPLGVVPIIPLYNNPTMLGGGRSELLPAMPLQDAINKELADMIIASEFAAFPQRVMMGVEVPKDPETGQTLPGVEMKAAISRLWAFESPDARIGEFAAADLKNYTAAIDMLISHLAAQTRTPPHYLMGQIVNASGDALKAAETGLVAKVRRKQLDFSDSWEEAIRLAFLVKGDAKRGKATDAEVIWADPENRSEAEITDAALKQQMLGVPLDMLWERLGYTPQQRTRMGKLRGLPTRSVDAPVDPAQPALPGDTNPAPATGVGN